VLDRLEVRELRSDEDEGLDLGILPSDRPRGMRRVATMGPARLSFAAVVNRILRVEWGMNMSRPPEDATTLLAAMSTGDDMASEKLFYLLYEELHALAHRAIRNEPAEQLLQTTALIHETYIRLVGREAVQWNDKSHFFRVAAKAMRRVLVDEARRRRAAKRGGGKRHLSLHGIDESDSAKLLKTTSEPFAKLDLLDQALNKLAANGDLKHLCSIVEMRYFGGLSYEHIAKAMDMSKDEVKREWDFTRSWLFQQMKEAENRDDF